MNIFLILSHIKKTDREVQSAEIVRTAEDFDAWLLIGGGRVRLGPFHDHVIDKCTYFSWLQYFTC